MTTAVAKVFQSGNSQAIRLPKAFRLKSRTVKLSRTAEGILISEDDEDQRKARAFARLAGSCPTLKDVPPHLTPDLPRDL
jgi:antitoxin VapB